MQRYVSLCLGPVKRPLRWALFKKNLICAQQPVKQERCGFAREAIVCIGGPTGIHGAVLFKDRVSQIVRDIGLAGIDVNEASRAEWLPILPHEGRRDRVTPFLDQFPRDKISAAGFEEVNQRRRIGTEEIARIGNIVLKVSRSSGP